MYKRLTKKDTPKIYQKEWPYFLNKYIKLIINKRTRYTTFVEDDPTSNRKWSINKTTDTE